MILLVQIPEPADPEALDSLLPWSPTLPRVFRNFKS
jgi:hypothetical protein